MTMKPLFGKKLNKDQILNKSLDEINFNVSRAGNKSFSDRTFVGKHLFFELFILRMEPLKTKRWIF